jgi:hypothetical protein
VVHCVCVIRKVVIMMLLLFWLFNCSRGGHSILSY